MIPPISARDNWCILGPKMIIIGVKIANTGNPQPMTPTRHTYCFLPFAFICSQARRRSSSSTRGGLPAPKADRALRFSARRRKYFIVRETINHKTPTATKGTKFVSAGDKESAAARLYITLTPQYINSPAMRDARTTRPAIVIFCRMFVSLRRQTGWFQIRTMRVKVSVELRSTRQPRAVVPTWVVENPRSHRLLQRFAVPVSGCRARFVGAL